MLRFVTRLHKNKYFCNIKKTLLNRNIITSTNYLSEDELNMQSHWYENLNLNNLYSKDLSLKQYYPEAFGLLKEKNKLLRELSGLNNWFIFQKI